MRSQILDSIDLQRHALFPVPVREVLFAAYRGSVAHGTYLPGSDPHSVDDIDLIGCCYGGLDHYFGLEDWGSRGTRELRVEINGTLYDCVYYELRKFLRLLAQANPNVLASLWMEPEYYPRFSPEAKILLHCRRLFLTQQAYRSFVGYAYSQLKDVTRNKFSGYMGEKRKALVKKFGYDVKHASHLIRLLRMGRTAYGLPSRRGGVDRNQARRLESRASPAGSQPAGQGTGVLQGAINAPGKA